MLRTKCDIKLEMVNGANGHFITWGQSGQGKTFFLCRKVEEYVEKGKKVLILDFSGSFSEKELTEKKFRFFEQCVRYKVADSLVWNLRVGSDETFKMDVTDAFLEVLCCDSYFQQSLLEEAVKRALDTENGEISIPAIAAELKRMLQEEKASEATAGNADNLGRLLMRLRPYESIQSFHVKRSAKCENNFAPVSIIDVSNFPEKQRRFLTELMLSLLWKESFRQEFDNRCDVLVLDEFQFLPVKDGSSLSTFLREGRKKGWELALGTQFIKSYSTEELQTLQQAANFVIFHPTPEDSRFSAKIIDKGEYRRWEKILMSLEKGEAVLKGNYRLENAKKVLATPVVVKI